MRSHRATPTGARGVTSHSGPHVDHVQVESQDGTPLTWTLTGIAATASLDSDSCGGSITIIKRLDPSDDPGRFFLEIDGAPAGDGRPVGDGGTTGTIAVTAGTHSVGESGAGSTKLSDYVARIVCRTDRGAGPVGGSVRAGGGAGSVSVPVTVGRGDAIVCTITNTRKPVPPDPPKPPEFLDLVVTKTAEPTTVRVGELITWTMTVTNESSVEAADVNGSRVDDRPYGIRLLSLTTSQGVCALGAGCQLGRLLPGASVTVTAVTQGDAGRRRRQLRAGRFGGDRVRLPQQRPPARSPGLSGIRRAPSSTAAGSLVAHRGSSGPHASRSSWHGSQSVGEAARERRGRRPAGPASRRALGRTRGESPASTSPRRGSASSASRVSAPKTDPVTRLGCQTRVGVLPALKPPPLTGRPA